MSPQDTTRAPQQSPVSFSCDRCLSRFTVKASRAARGNVHFCSRACADAGRPHPRRPLAERFWEKVDKTSSPHGCWLFTGSVNKSGYGYIGPGGKHATTRRVHVVSWEMEHGPVPKGNCVCHSCDQYYPKGDTTYRACLRPDHLFLGSHQSNMDDMKAKGRANRIGRKPWKTTLP